MCDVHATVSNDRIVKARKPYRCDECHWDIGVGESHRYFWGLFDGDPASFRFCLACVRAHAEVEAWITAENERRRAQNPLLRHRPDIRGYDGEDACIPLNGLWDYVSENQEGVALLAGPEVRLFVARVTYQQALRWRQRKLEMADQYDREGYPKVGRYWRGQANKDAWKWIGARDTLVAAGVGCALPGVPTKAEETAKAMAAIRAGDASDARRADR